MSFSFIRFCFSSKIFQGPVPQSPVDFTLEYMSQTLTVLITHYCGCLGPAAIMSPLDCLSILLTGLFASIPASFSLLSTQQLEQSFKNGIQKMLLLYSNLPVISDALHEQAPTAYLTLPSTAHPPLLLFINTGLMNFL